MTVSSSYILPTIWRPTGRPLEAKPAGMLAAGWADDVDGVGEGVEAEELVRVGGLAGYLFRELAYGDAGYGEGGGNDEIELLEDVGYLSFELVSPAEGAGVVGDGYF